MATTCLPLWEQKGSACFEAGPPFGCDPSNGLPDVSLQMEPADPVLGTLSCELIEFFLRSKEVFAIVTGGEKSFAHSSTATKGEARI